MLPGRAAAIAAARSVLSGVDQITISDNVLDDAATLAPDAAVRSLDAIHLASARLFGADLHALVTYDARMTVAAEQLMLPVAAPQ